MISHLFLIFIVFQFLSAEFATYQGQVDLQCSYVCVSKSNQGTNNGSFPRLDNGSYPTPKNSSFPRPNSCNEVISYYQSKVIVTLANGPEVMCDTETDGGGWLVIQRRINGKLDFYRGWEDYKKGFGDYVNGEFYLGNENIHRISTSGIYELRIDLEYLNTTYLAHYSRFYLLNETEGYKLHVSEYSGNAGDNLSEHSGMKFTTFDRDLDTSPSVNCAVSYQGAWWYSSCHSSNLNGLWGNKEYGKGLNWFALTGYYDSVSRSEMKIRKI